MRAIPFWWACLLLVSTAGRANAADAPRAAILAAGDGDAEAPVVAALRESMRETGYELAVVGRDQLIDPAAFSALGLDLLVLPDARRLPLEGIGAVEGFLQRGGNLIACGLPAWEEGLVKAGDRWLTREDQRALLDAVRPVQRVADFEQDDLAAWQRSSNSGDPPARYAVVDRALHVAVPRLSGWATLGRDFPGAFPKGHTLTCFRARGGPHTDQLVLEWQEADGARWLATVRLTPEWKYYALPPEAFSAWTPPPGRGGPGDRLRIENARRFAVGLAISHSSLPVGAHEYWFDDLGTAPSPLGTLPKTADIPHLELLSPGYFFFPITAPSIIRNRAGHPWAAELRLESPANLLALHPRTCGTGYDKGRPWRWQVLLQAEAPDGDYRGAVGALMIPLERKQARGVRVAFTPTDSSFYRDPAFRRTMAQVATAIQRGVFLREGGSEFYTVFDGQEVRLGAKVLCLARRAAQEVTVRITATPDRASQPAWQRSWTMAVQAGGEADVQETWRPATWPRGGYRVTTDLLLNGEVIDTLSHELRVWRPRTSPRFIEARNGGFWLDGKSWKAHGVNYMPSSGIAISSGVFEHWAGAAGYDPEVIDRDLRRIKAMNMNAISAFIYHQSLAAMNMLDFLGRCEEVGLHVNLSLRPGTPLDFRWREMREMIETLRLAQNDTVFAYDLAWEPSHYNHTYQQQRYARGWSAWVLKKYGSVDKAQEAWGVPAPAGDGGMTVPLARQLVEDGPWRRLVADYRAFMDEMLHEAYAEARRLVRSVDPHHPVSFRMQMSGDPTHNDTNLMPYDFLGLARAVDIWEPEAYGRIGGWEQVRPGHFTAAYARLCDPSKPVLWAEMGVSTWDLATMAPDPQKLAFQASYFRDFHRMMRESGADGVFYWWYPGGYRLNEKSDYGIINPDGTDRPVTRVIREEGPRLLAAPKPPQPDIWLEVDRDSDARGLHGIYKAVGEQYWQALDAGRTPGLRWRR